jgi:hypothetical protein
MPLSWCDEMVDKHWVSSAFAALVVGTVVVSVEDGELNRE